MLYDCSGEFVEPVALAHFTSLFFYGLRFYSSCASRRNTQVSDKKMVCFVEEPGLGRLIHKCSYKHTKTIHCMNDQLVRQDWFREPFKNKKGKGVVSDTGEAVSD